MEVSAIVFPFPTICFSEEKYTDKHRNNEDILYNMFITSLSHPP